MMKTFILSLLTTLTLGASAFAASEGTAVGVNPDAVSQLGTVERTLVVGTDVSVGERVVTGPSGRVQLLFADQTRIVVGPRSALVIEDYLLSGDQVSRFAVNALAGTFRFISGNSPKSAYSVETPTATIAVRGTEYDLTVGDGQTMALLFEGAVELCSGTTCFELTDRCDIAVVGSGRDGLYKWNQPRSDLVGFFPLPNIQSAFRVDFRVDGAQACLAPRSSSVSESSSSSDPGTPAFDPQGGAPVFVPTPAPPVVRAPVIPGRN